MGVDERERGFGGRAMSRKPTIRIVRNLARSGGTLIGKCIGCMEGVTLISEIHPADLKTTKPMMQAQKWFGLIQTKDIVQWKVRPPNVLQFVHMCDTRAQAMGQTLVLRDWSHLDYIGVPFATPKHGFALSDALEAAYDVEFVTTVRHPVDQYMSLMQLHVVSEKLVFEKYLYGCMRFAEFAAEHGFTRYEDFTKDPDSALRSLCEGLNLDFDPGYRDRWHQYTTITGDTVPALGRGSMKKTIEHFERKPIEDSLLAAFRENGDYRRACALLGYEA